MLSTRMACAPLHEHLIKFNAVRVSTVSQLTHHRERMPKFSRRTVIVEVRQRDVTRTAVPAPDDGIQKTQGSSTDFERSLRQEKGSRFDADAKPGR